MIRTTRSVIVTIVLASATSVFAQERFEPIESGVADADPLAVGLRELQVDLRDPIGFEQVYKVPGRDDLLMRVDGGLFAIFPRSVYVDSRSGAVPVIPNNTTFFIGEPLFELLPPADGPSLPAARGREESVARRETRIADRLAVRPVRSDVLGLRLMRKVDGKADDTRPAGEPATDAGSDPVLARAEETVAAVTPAVPAPDQDRWQERVRELMRRAAAGAKHR